MTTKLQLDLSALDTSGVNPPILNIMKYAREAYDTENLSCKSPVTIFLAKGIKAIIEHHPDINDEGDVEELLRKLSSKFSRAQADSNAHRAETQRVKQHMHDEEERARYERKRALALDALDPVTKTIAFVEKMLGAIPEAHRPVQPQPSRLN